MEPKVFLLVNLFYVKYLNINYELVLNFFFFESGTLHF